VTDAKRRLLGMGIPFALAFLPATALAVGRDSTLDAGDCLVFHAMYRIHPLAMIGGYLAWGGAVLGLLVLLPEVLAVILTIAVVFGHVAGVYSQLTMDLGKWWYQAANGLFLITAIALGSGLWWSARGPSIERAVPEKHLPPARRWGLIAFLLVVAGGLILIPLQR